MPCVVGTRDATTLLHDGQTRHRRRPARRGLRGRGRGAERRRGPVGSRPRPVERRCRAEPIATRLYVNLAVAEHAEQVAALDVDGVGLLRAEFMVADALQGVHPRLLHRSAASSRPFVDAMTDSLLRITRAFAPRPVVYRSIDFRSNEFRGLEGGEEFEPDEDNPMIGYRGCFRYVDQPDLFRLELDVLGAVARPDAQPAADDPVRAHRVGAARRCLDIVRAPRPRGRPAGLGDGRGAVGRLLDPDLRADGHRRASRSAATT